MTQNGKMCCQYVMACTIVYTVTSSTHTHTHTNTHTPPPGMPPLLRRVMEGFSDSVVTMDARYAWKYAASRAVTGTPQFIVNGVIVPTAPSFSLDQWTTFISSIINTPTC